MDMPGPLFFMDGPGVIVSPADALRIRRLSAPPARRDAASDGEKLICRGGLDYRL